MVKLGKLGSAPTTPTSHDDTKHSDSGEHILRDGSVPFTGNQSMGSNKITSLTAGAASGEAVEFDQLHAAVTLGGGSAAELTLVGQALTLAAVLTPTEHTAIGDGAPHHAKYTDAEAVSAVATADDYLKNDAADSTSGDLTVPNLITAGNVDGRDVSADGTKLDTIDTNADVTGDNPPQSHDYDVHSGGVPYAELEYDDATSDPLVDGAAAADGTEASAARKDHVHPRHHAQAHGPSDHTEGTAWRLVYQDASGDEQEIGLGTDGQVLTSTGAASAPAMEALPAAGAHGPAAHTSFANWKLIYTDGSGDQQELALGTDGQVLKATGASAAPVFEDDLETINFIIDGGGSAITTGVKGDIVVDFACTIQSWTILPDQSGSIVIDIWKDSYANFPPTDADSMCSGKEPTLTATTKAQDTDVTDWTTDDITAGDCLRFNVDSITTCERVTLSLKVKRT